MSYIVAIARAHHITMFDSAVIVLQDRLPVRATAELADQDILPDFVILSCVLGKDKEEVLSEGLAKNAYLGR